MVTNQSMEIVMTRCSRVTIVVLGVLVAASVACAGDGTGVDDGGGGGAVTLSQDVQPILTQNCALSGCHVGANPEQGQDLSAGQTFASVVNVASNQVPTMNRVTPGQPDNSYLVHKIQGTHASIGGTGDRMPLARTPLTQAQIDLIRTWILEGALQN